MVHFSPGPKLHQTLTYKADVTYVCLGSREDDTYGSFFVGEPSFGWFLKGRQQ